MCGVDACANCGGGKAARWLTELTPQIWSCSSSRVRSRRCLTGLWGLVPDVTFSGSLEFNSSVPRFNLVIIRVDRGRTQLHFLQILRYRSPSMGCEVCALPRNDCAWGRSRVRRVDMSRGAKHMAADPVSPPIVQGRSNLAEGIKGLG